MHQVENGRTSRVIILLMLIGLALRIGFALSAQNIDHPDEIFQYLEPAHRMVFGYGFVTWEYRFGTRCWLIPFLISLPLYVCKMFGAADPAVYIPVVKCLFCLLSTSLIFSCYIIARNLVSERAGIFAAILCTFWYELIYFSFRPLSDVVSAYFMVAALAFVLDRGRQGRPFLFASLAAVAALLRTQYLPALLFLAIIAAFSWPRDKSLKWVATMVAVLLLGGLFDYLTWGSFFASTSNSLLFNGVYNVGILFSDARPPLWLVEALISTSTGILLLAFFASLFFYRRLWVLTAMVGIILVSHSLVPSKEYRYIFAVIPLLLTLFASCCDLFFQAKLPGLRVKLAYRVVGVYMMLLSLAGLQNWLPNETAVYRFKPLSAGQPGINAFDILAREKDVSGVLIDRRLWWETGGYYHLHHPVPLYQPQVDFRDCSQADSYISHMICPQSSLCAGFEKIADCGPVSVGKKTKAHYSTFPNWNYNLLQSGIDDRYKPNVHPFLSK